MPLMKKFRDLNKNHFKTVKKVLKWYDTTLADKKDLSVMSISSAEDMLMGKIYRFYYKPDNLIKLPYYDINPLVISLGQSDSKTELGLNLNYLPYDIKVFIINTLYKTYKIEIDSEVKSNPNNAKLQSYLNLDYDTLNNLFPTLNLSFATRNYLKQNRTKTTIISYDNLVRIPFIEDAKFIKKTLGEIHGLYYLSVKNKLTNTK